MYKVLFGREKKCSLPTKFANNWANISASFKMAAAKPNRSIVEWRSFKSEDTP